MAHFTMPVDLQASRPVRCIGPDEPLQAAHERLSDLGISSLAVTDSDGRLIGVVTRTDLLRAGRRQAGSDRGAALLRLPDRPVSQVMTPEVLAVSPQTSVAEAAALLVGARVHRVFLVEEGRPTGVFSVRDVLEVIRAQRLNKPLSDFMSSPLFTVRAEEPISLATERLEKARVTGLVVVDGEWPVGAFTQVEALASKDDARSTPIEDVMSPAILCLDEDAPLWRAAAQAAALRVRRVVAMRGRRPVGILTGLDFARAAT